MRAAEIAPGLWRWTARHPAWRPARFAGSTGDWDPEVGSVLVETGAAAVFIDALVPADGEQDFWRWADARVGAAERVLALTTIGFHSRSRRQIAERYGASRSRAKGSLPEGLETVRLPGTGETDYWLPAQRALVVGDRLLGAPGGGLRLCPPSWLGYLPGKPDCRRLGELLTPLLELPVERVLVSHGEPVLSGGHEAIAEALGR